MRVSFPSPRTHVSQFPSEVLSAVFRDYLGSFVDNNNAYVADLDTIRLVCRFWDYVVVGDALLWTYIFVDQRTSFDALRLRLKRAGDFLKLTISVNFFWGRRTGPLAARSYSVAPVSTVGPTLTFVDDLFYIIGPLFHRCRRFDLFTEDMRATRLFMHHLHLLDASSLVHARLHVCPAPLHVQRAFVDMGDHSDEIAGTMFGGIMPRLTTLQFQRCYFLGTNYQFCQNLIDLRLQHLWHPYALKFSELFALLTVTTVLERLHLWFVSCSDFDDCIIPAPTLLHLTHLAFGPMSVTSCAVLDLISMPKLRTLDLHVHSPLTVHPALRFCQALFKQITSVILSVDRVLPGEVVSLISLWPRIQRLDARTSSSVVVDALRLITSNPTMSFPSLNSIALPHQEENADGGLTAALLRSDAFGGGLRVVRNAPPFGGHARLSWATGPNGDEVASEVTSELYDFFGDTAIL
ncbi:hypothetical protein C8J57DRAFT_1643733 [Mycena rebaudengoi]|nr:hypothetical protein C8J57DRAFT_1643733 [Mycena rebaudengoi]